MKVKDADPEPHYILMHINFESYTASFYDSLTPEETPRNSASFNISAWNKSFIIPCPYKYFTKIKSKGGYYVTDKINDKGQLVPLENNKNQAYKRVFVQDKTVLFNHCVEISNGCGEICCMHLLQLLTPSIAEEEIWFTYDKHRAHVLSLVVHHLIHNIEIIKNMFGVPEETFEFQRKVIRHLMQVDFGATFEEVFDSVCLCHYGWQSDTCLVCMDQVYQDTGTDILVRACCGKRYHAQCFLNELESETEIPLCQSVSCMDASHKSDYNNHFVFLQHN